MTSWTGLGDWYSQGSRSRASISIAVTRLLFQNTHQDGYADHVDEEKSLEERGLTDGEQKGYVVSTYARPSVVLRKARVKTSYITVQDGEKTVVKRRLLQHIVESECIIHLQES